METQKYFYYRMYDDKEEKIYFKSQFEHTLIHNLVAEFEKTHQDYYNNDFITFLKEKDQSAEVIEIHNVYY